MLIRRDDHGLLLISQPAHAWIAGQLARAWGNERVGAVVPREELVLAATLHDVGWLGWESAPTLNPETGLPHTFLELPIDEHLRIWDAAADDALTFGPFVALYTSLHGSGLYERRSFDDPEAADARLVSAFLARERERQAALLATLRAGSVDEEATTDATIERNRRLIAVWDMLSLFIGYGGRSTRTIDAVPGADAPLDLRLEVDGNLAILDPWPFAVASVTLVAQARRVSGASAWSDVESLRSDLARAVWETLAITLRPERP